MSEAPRPLRRLRGRMARIAGECVGDLAVERGWITLPQLCAAQEMIDRGESDLAIGPLLVRGGFLTPSQLEELSGQAPMRDLAGNAPPEAEAAAREPGNVFGKYIRVREIGRGGMGIVHRAWQKDLGRWVALKQLQVEGAANLARFVREGRLAAQINHPNLVPIYEVGEFEGRPFLAMALVDGTSLEGRRLPIRKALEIILQVARATQDLHAAGILHRDIKPGNVMVDAMDRVFLGDFSLARAEEGGAPLSQTGLMLGTPAYAPPEQVRGDKGAVGPRSDVYALGATLFSLLTGEPPFTGKDGFDVARRTLDSEPPSLRSLRPDVNSHIETICWKAMRKRPEERYASAREFADDVQRYLNGETLVARPPGFSDRLGMALRRHRVPLAVTGVALLTGAVFVVVLFFQADRKEEADRNARAEKIRVELRDAARAEREGNIDRARDGFRRVLDLDPAAGDARKGLERVEGAQARALALLEAARPSIQKAVEGLYRKETEFGEVIRSADKGLELVEESIGLARHLPLGPYLSGIALEIKGEWDAAESAWRKAITLDPRFGPAHFHLGRLLMMRSFFAMLGRKGGARDAMHPLGLGFAAEAGREIDLAMAATSGFDDELLRAVGGVLLAFLKDDRAGAARLAREGIAAWGARGVNGVEEFHLFLALAADGDERMKEFDIALGIRPKFLPALVCRSSERLSRGDFEGVVADCTAAIRMNPNLEAGYSNRGFAFLRLRQFDRAVEDYAVCVRISPRDPVAWAARGGARRKKGDASGALEDYAEALRLDSDYALAWGGRGAVRADLGNLDEAIADFDQALRIEPDNLQALRERAGALANRGRFEAAVVDCDRALALSARDSDMHVVRGQARWYLGRRDEAIEDLRKALELAPQPSPMRELAVQLLEKFTRERK